MADIGGSHNDAFGLGVAYQVNPGRANSGSITLGTDAGLDQTSQRWNGLTPHSVLASTVGAGSDDGSWQRMQRDAGGYALGSFEELSDQLSSGTNDNID